MWEAADACIKCTLCVSQCPVVSVNSDFPGPKALGPEWYRNQQGQAQTIMLHVDDCTFCQICESACPVNVPIAHLIAEHKHAVRRSWRLRLRDNVLSRPHWVARTAGWAKEVGKPLRALAGLSPDVRLPQRHMKRVAPLGERLAEGLGTVGLFVDCYSGGYEPSVIAQATELLQLWGYDVVSLPQGSCCGAAAFASGNPDLGRRVGRKTWTDLHRKTEIDALVTLNATCDGTLREEWPRFFNLELRVPVVPFDEIAMSAPDEFWERLRRVSDSQERWLTHTTCRGKVARGDGHLLKLALRAGLQGVEPSDAACCGAAGSYAFKAEHAATARQLVSHLQKQVEVLCPSGILTDSGTCAIHIEQATEVPTRHPAYWLYRQYRRYLGEGVHQ